MIRLRWRIVFAPVCWVAGHRWQHIEYVPMGFGPPYRCRRCFGTSEEVTNR